LINFLEYNALDEYKYHNFKEEFENEDSVKIMTVHKSKGLEFHSVFIPELEEKEFPPANLGGKKYWTILGGRFETEKERFIGNEEDERKLFYVAVTRAKQNIFMLYTLTSNELSRFVKEAAESSYLDVDMDDLYYKKPQNKRDRRNSMNFDFEDDIEDELDDEWDNNKQYETGVYHVQDVYKEQASTARKNLMDYYGTAMHSGMRMAGADLVRVQSMNDEDVINEAKKMRLI
jgi:ATP-dependent exoDNAse (exonuclease V) beta subunit